MAVCRHGPILKSKAKKKEILGSPFFCICLFNVDRRLGQSVNALP